MQITFKRFESELARQGKSAATQRGYLSDRTWSSARWGDVVRLSRLSMERLIMSFSTPILYYRELPSNYLSNCVS